MRDHTTLADLLVTAFQLRVRLLDDGWPKQTAGLPLPAAQYSYCAKISVYRKQAIDGTLVSGRVPGEPLGKKSEELFVELDGVAVPFPLSCTTVPKRALGSSLAEQPSRRADVESGRSPVCPWSTSPEEEHWLLKSSRAVRDRATIPTGGARS